MKYHKANTSKHTFRSVNVHMLMSSLSSLSSLTSPWWQLVDFGINSTIATRLQHNKRCHTYHVTVHKMSIRFIRYEAERNHKLCLSLKLGRANRQSQRVTSRCNAHITRFTNTLEKIYCVMLSALTEQHCAPKRRWKNSTNTTMLSNVKQLDERSLEAALPLREWRLLIMKWTIKPQSRRFGAEPSRTCSIASVGTKWLEERLFL